MVVRTFDVRGLILQTFLYSKRYKVHTFFLNELLFMLKSSFMVLRRESLVFEVTIGPRMVFEVVFGP